MGYFEKILKTFAYNGWADLASSLAPSIKYEHITAMGITLSSVIVVVQVMFGLDALAFLALLVIMVAELSSGIIASKIRKEKFSSMKLSRFTFKVAYYLIGFRATDQELAYSVFHWMHLFLTIQIVLENIVSVLENLSVISGKEKTHWIRKIQDKIQNLLN